MIQNIGRHTVRVFGRTVMDGGMLWLLSSLSGIGFRVAGARRLEIMLESDDTTADPARKHLTPRFDVLVDGDIVIDRCMKEREETVTVFDSGKPWGAEIRFRKLSECTQSILAIREIRTDGKIVPLEEKGTKIEFIGDSVTCGYGVEGKSELEGFTTATENAGKSYAGLVTEWMGLDSMLTCFSGYGIVSGYTDDPERRNTGELVPPYYEVAGRNAFTLPSGRRPEEIPWDFSSWQPDIVCIRLMTNDNNGMNERRSFETDRETVIRGGMKLIRKVRKHNARAKIVWVLPGTDCHPELAAEAVKRMQEEGFTDLYTFTLPDYGPGDLGARWHPNAEWNRMAGELLGSYLKTIV